MGRNLTNLYISQSFQFLTQISGSELQTGLGDTITGSLLITASKADTATTASYALNALSASYSNASTSASYALVSTSSSFAINATSASYALNSTSVSFASNVGTLINLTVTGTGSFNGFVILSQVSASLNFADDTAAAAGGVPLGGLYRSGNFILIRLT